ncbi:MAG: hypothetical protein ABI821_16815 [Pseudomonadota bacterium]
MRRLTLILSDLYLPEEAARAAAVQPLELPHLDWLLRFAHSTHITDWRHWLARDLGRADLVSPAATLAAGEVAAAGDFVWLATPVRLEARLDHVRMLERGLPRVAAAERDQWREEFTRTFAPYVLHDAGPRGFVLSGLAPAQVETVDPARLLDTEIGHALPSGAPARELRRLSAEIEMWMHGATVNLARERSGLPRLTSLWLWGGGPRLPLPPRALPENRSILHFHGDDPAFAALARATIGAFPTNVPAGFAEVRAASDRVLVELMPINGAPAESLAALEANWFAPVRAALSDGTLAAFDIIANDRWFRVAARPAWRLWRGNKPWLTQLGQRHARTKA